ncbi:MAG: hypothetical protein Q7U00_04155 [Sulfurimonas sp.]|nr:hypothetical protein [Sulfurimonas sp.]
MLLNILLIIVGSVYWYYTEHAVPLFIGLALLVSLYNDSLYFTSLIISAVAISSIIYFFWADIYSYRVSTNTLHYGIGIIYMLVLFLKAKSIFNADRTSL